MNNTFRNNDIINVLKRNQIRYGGSVPPKKFQLFRKRSKPIISKIQFRLSFRPENFPISSLPVESLLSKWIKFYIPIWITHPILPTAHMGPTIIGFPNFVNRMFRFALLTIKIGDPEPKLSAYYVTKKGSEVTGKKDRIMETSYYQLNKIAGPAQALFGGNRP